MHFLRTFNLRSVVKGQTMIRSMSTSHLLEMVQSSIPPLSEDLHKGQCGRIGIIGGCKEYTGAPYYAAISALKVGADLSHVFCTSGAASVIKSYSPELIVHPVLDSKDYLEEVDKWLPRLHVLVIGPGLGRESHVLDAVKGIICKAKQRCLPLVIDADGVFLVTEHPEIIQGNNQVILTPNAMEFSRLYRAVLKDDTPTEADASHVSNLSDKLGNVTIVRKGKTDLISVGSGSQVLECSVEGSWRRCGGQGDLLSGAMGTFLHWAILTSKNGTGNTDFSRVGPFMCAAYAACALTRTCNRLSFSRFGRSMTTVDMIAHIHDAFTQLYEKNGSNL